MRLELGVLQLRDTKLDLPEAEGQVAQHVLVERAESLHGVLEQSEGRTALRGIGAERLALGPAQLVFGSVQIRSEGPAALDDIELEMLSGPEPLALLLRSQKLEFACFSVCVGNTRVSARVHFERAELELAEGRGRVRAEVVSLQEFALSLGSLELSAPQLDGRGLELGWGDEDGFWMRVEAAEADSVEAPMPALHALLSGARVMGFEWAKSVLSIADVTCRALEVRPVEASGDRETTPEQRGSQKVHTHTSRPVWDPRLLDGLDGELHFDVFVDVSFTSLLRRKVVHPFRLAVNQGSIDFRRLEHSLSKLEDLLFDFSVRDEHLVLELGIPLLPSRGHGKRLVQWPLKGDDVKRARDHQMRVSLLPSYELCIGGGRKSQPQPVADKGGGDSLFQLHTIELRWHPSTLRLTPPAHAFDAALPLLAFEQIVVEGQLDHASAGEPPPGALTASVHGLQVRCDELGVGDQGLSGLVTADAITQLTLRTQGTTPHSLQCDAKNVRVRGLRLG